MSPITNNIRRIIDAKGIKQKAVASRAGYSEKTFSAMMNGRRTIKADDILKIANALSVEPNALFQAQARKEGIYAETKNAHQLG